MLGQVAMKRFTEKVKLVEIGHVEKNRKEYISLAKKEAFSSFISRSLHSTTVGYFELSPLFQFSRLFCHQGVHHPGDKLGKIKP